MKIIVAGGTGYIGSHTVVELQEEGFEVVVLDNLYNSEQSVIERIGQITGQVPVFEKVDLCDYAATSNIFAKHKDAVAVIHFAAMKAVGESVEKPIVYYENNLISTINLLKIMDEVGIPNMIFSSSATVYGKYPNLSVKEDDRLYPSSSPYGATKQMIEVMLKDAIIGKNAITGGISLRYFNPIGAHSSLLLGEVPKGAPNNLLPYITQTAAGIRKELSVFGNDYDTKDGTAIRDYIHVVDLAKAHVKAVQRLINGENKTPYEVFNLGSGKGHSVLEVIHAFEKMNGVKVNYKIVARREGDEPAMYGNVKKAEMELNWKAELSLEEMVKSAWDWEKNYRAGQTALPLP